MERNFTDEKLTELSQFLANDNDKFYDPIRDFGLGVNLFFNVLFGGDSFRQTTNYYEKVFQVNDTSYQELSRIFSDANQLDSSYATTFGELKTTFDFYKTYIGKMRDIMNNGPSAIYHYAVNSIFSTFNEAHNDVKRTIAEYLVQCAAGNEIELSHDDREFLEKYLEELTADRYGGNSDVLAMDEADRDMLITIYELLNEEDAENMNNFFLDMANDSSYDYSDDIANIKYITYTAPEPYRSAFLNNLTNIGLGSYDHDTSVSAQHYSQDGGKIYVDFTGANVGMNDPRGPYTTFFHEMGHGIDDFGYDGEAGGARMSDTYLNSDGLSLQDVARNDVEQHISNSIDNYINSYNNLCKPEDIINLSDTEKQQIIDEFMGQYSDVNNLPAGDMQNVYNEMVNRYGGYEYNSTTPPYCSWTSGSTYNVSGVYNEAVSDVFGGYTNNTLGGYGYGHRKEDDELISDYNYWYDSNGNETNKQSRELFAEYYSYNMVGTEPSINATENYFANSPDHIEEMLGGK